MAIDLQTRRKVMAALDRGEAAASIARRFEIGERSVYRLKARVDAGRPLAADKPGAKGSVKLTADDEQILRQVVAERPGVTAKEAIPKLSVKVVESTVCRACGLPPEIPSRFCEMISRFGLNQERSGYGT